MNVLTVFVEYFMLETPICLLYVCFKDCKAPRGRFLTLSNINKNQLDVIIRCDFLRTTLVSQCSESN